MIAGVFILNPNNYPQVNHKDENKQNNWASNLEWVTAMYNINYGTRTQKVANALRCRPDCSQRIYSIDKDGNIEYFGSISEAAKQMHGSTFNISHVLAGTKRYQTYRGRKWYRCPKESPNKISAETPDI